MKMMSMSKQEMKIMEWGGREGGGQRTFFFSDHVKRWSKKKKKRQAGERGRQDV